MLPDVKWVLHKSCILWAGTAGLKPALAIFVIKSGKYFTFLSILALWWLTQGKPCLGVVLGSCSLLLPFYLSELTGEKSEQAEHVFPQGKNFISSEEGNGQEMREETQQRMGLERGFLNLAAPCLHVFPPLQMRSEASVRKVKIRALFHNPLLIALGFLFFAQLVTSNLFVQSLIPMFCWCWMIYFSPQTETVHAFCN